MNQQQDVSWLVRGNDSLVLAMVGWLVGWSWLFGSVDRSFVRACVGSLVRSLVRACAHQLVGWLVGLVGWLVGLVGVCVRA